MNDLEFLRNAQDTCENALDLLLKSWNDDTPPRTMKETLQGLNALRDYLSMAEDSAQRAAHATA